MNNSCSADHQIMLLCHPDKKKGEAKEVLKDNSFLKNVKKAFDILGDPGKRRGYDSVDPLFEDEIPSEKAVTKSNFYRVSICVIIYCLLMILLKYCHY